jgi:hypothetical protein
MINPNFSTTNNLNENNYYFGVIESVNDPLGLHRVKCRIIGVHNDNRKLLTTNDLPWSLVANPTDGTGKHTLKPGNFVVCVFVDQDLQQPVVLYTLFSKIKTNNIKFNSIDDVRSPGTVFLTNNTSKIPDQIIYDGKLANEIVAKSQLIADIGNPYGRNTNTPTANGKSGGVGIFEDIQREIVSLANIFKYVELYDTDDITLSEDIDEGVGFIPLSRVESIPRSGIIKIDNEFITYNGIADTGLSGQIMRGSPDRGEIVPSFNATHTKGTSVQWIYPIVKNDNAPLFYSKLTGQAINFGKEIKKKMSVISGYITWITSQISAQITKLLSELISNITLVLKSPIAITGKLIVDALLLILSQVLCAFNKSTVDSLVDVIENYITEQLMGVVKMFYAAGGAVTDFITNCSNKIFDAILQFSSIIQSVGTIINAVTATKFPTASSFNISDGDGGLSMESITSAAPIVGNLLNLLGLGCRTDVGENKITYTDNNGTTCTTNGYFPDAILCAPNPDIIGELNNLYRPLPAFITSYDFGGGLKIEQDNTPGTERTLIQSPAGTYTEVFNDGTSKTVITKDNYTLILNDNFVEIKGAAYFKVDGDFGLKVSGNMDIEVGKELRMNIGGASKITYGGSHNTNYNNDAIINATNKLSITGAQIGLSGSGSVDIAGGVFTTVVNEANITSLGSLSLLSLYSNHVSTLSHKEIHSGSVDKLVLGTEKTINLSTHTADYIGARTENHSSILTTNVSGIHNVTNNSVYNVSSKLKVENVSELLQLTTKLTVNNSQTTTNNVSGSYFTYAGGINVRSSSANFDS